MHDIRKDNALSQNRNVHMTHDCQANKFISHLQMKSSKGDKHMKTLADRNDDVATGCLEQETKSRALQACQKIIRLFFLTEQNEAQ